MDPWTVRIGHLNDLLAEAPKEEKNEKSTLEELNIPQEVIVCLRQMKICHPSTIQRLSMKKALQKRNLIVQAKNGTGKSLSICIIVASRLVQRVKRRQLHQADGKDAQEGEKRGQLETKRNGADPPVSLFLHSIILVPTRELCVQLCDNIKEISNQGIFIKGEHEDLPPSCDPVCSSSPPDSTLSDHLEGEGGNKQIGIRPIPFEVKPMVLYGGTDVKENLRMIFSYLPHVIISTPGRLKHVLSILKRLHVQVGQTERAEYPIQVPLIKITNVLIKQFILDEVDALLEEQFEEQIKCILSQVIRPKVQVLCYSSTFLESAISNFLKMVNLHDLGYVSRWKGFCVKRIDQMVSGDRGPNFRSGGLHESCVGDNSIMPVCEAQPEMNVRHTVGQDTSLQNDVVTTHQSNESDENEVAEEDAPLDECHNKDEVNSPLHMSQNNQMVQSQNVFQDEMSMRYMLQKIIKEKRNIGMCARRKREFEFVQTCTSVIIHEEGATGRDKSSHHVVKQFACEEGDVAGIPFNGTKGSDEENGSADVLGSPILRNVRHCFITVDNESMNKHEELKYKMKIILKVIKEINFHHCFLFINNTYEGVQVSKMLNKHDVSCYYTSSKLDHHERMKVFNKLKRNEMKVVVCSDVMSRGVDNIVCDLVINFDIPQNKETYIHRSGRCGRYGNRGLCISLCNYSDYAYLHFFKYQLRLPVHDFCYVRRERQFAHETNQFAGDTNQFVNETNQAVEGSSQHGAAWRSCYDLRGTREEGGEDIRENATLEQDTPEDTPQDSRGEDTVEDALEDTWEGVTQGERSASCAEAQLGVHVVEQNVPLQPCRLTSTPRRKALALNIKGFCAEGIHIAGERGSHVSSQSDDPVHRVHLKVRMKNFVTKFKIVKNQVCCQFCIPNDNINLFKSMSIVQHNSNLIIFFLFKRRIRMRFVSFRSMALREEETGRRSNYCFLFFCNSDSYLVLKVFYFFLFLFKHYQYPLRESLTPLLIHTGGGITQKEGKWKSRCDKCCNVFHPNQVNLNYVSDTCLMISNNIQNTEKKKKKILKDTKSDHTELVDMESTHTDQIQDNVDHEILPQRAEEELQPSSLSLEHALNQIKANLHEKKKIITFSQQCSEVVCMNDQREIVQKVNNLVAPQVFLNLPNRKQDAHLLKGLFLQSHVQLHGGPRHG
ncbi:hypothetical protein AK88_05160 [Plasmodium fragile]|uniref:Helicase C-terminal domain-containing protein n=1 Tax=Plasmodium fragile TaxID=5857 RepID=A0A0D9QHL9_PLAFR|nr:uncharacterized protein AK88_05160 [Plasmodium fragile]KJP85201.1 hypothetical protein AK88_05160 [Plasmodium fragile]